MVSRTASGLPPLGLANLAALGYGGCWGRAVGAQVALGPGLPTLRRSALERLGEFSAPEVLWLASGLQGAGVLDGAALAAARAALDHLGAGADGSLPTPWGTRLEAPPSAPGSPEVLSERDEVFAIYKPPGWSAATGFASGAHPRLADFLARAARRWPISGDAAEDRDGDTPDLTPAAPCSPRRRTGASGACVWSCAPRSGSRGSTCSSATAACPSGGGGVRSQAEVRADGRPARTAALAVAHLRGPRGCGAGAEDYSLVLARPATGRTHHYVAICPTWGIPWQPMRRTARARRAAGARAPSCTAPPSASWAQTAAAAAAGSSRRCPRTCAWRWRGWRQPTIRLGRQSQTFFDARCRHRLHAVWASCDAFAVTPPVGGRAGRGRVL
ncbi:unnamed protein product [Prorocentrum cordatum]|uniref:Inositol-pentakisphosphate 2-kinase n=1 Tax=Prorocentrum cordatum TaxID=2364126 RepID=A0ABN9ULB2_9DINO|nr:unnamed protein product [Polarella glacialis]